jgi:SAM-dependent methyltransferase
MVWVPTDSLPRQVVNTAIDCLAPFINSGELMPPFSMRRFVGESRFDVRGRDFRATGAHFLEKLTADAGLTSSSRVLDLGSGCGRVAIPLTGVLGEGFYRGLDVSKQLVRWCQRKITPRYPAFQFAHADVRTELYNPRGKAAADAYTLPFPEGHFDLVIATSVFTHLLPRAIEHYLRECSRVLAGGGHLFATFFLIESGTRSPDGGLNFEHEFEEGSRVVDPESPQKAIAVKTEWVLEMASRSGLEAKLPVCWGLWPGRQHGYSWQDVIIFSKRS